MEFAVNYMHEFSVHPKMHSITCQCSQIVLIFVYRNPCSGDDDECCLSHVCCCLFRGYVFMSFTKFRKYLLAFDTLMQTDIGQMHACVNTSTIVNANACVDIN